MGNAASAPTLTGKLKTETESAINAVNSLATYQRRPTLSRFVSTVELLTRALIGAEHTLETSRFTIRSNGQTAEVGTGTNVSDFPTLPDELGCPCPRRLPAVRAFIQSEVRDVKHLSISPSSTSVAVA
jgi:hypothetical protein